MKEIKWKKLLKEVEKGDDLSKEGWEEFVEDVEKSNFSRKNWITDELIEKLKTDESEFKKFLAKVFGKDEEKIKEIINGPWLLDTPPKLEEELVKNQACSRIVIKDPWNEKPTAYPGKPVGEVKEVLEELIQDGVVEIVPVYLFKLRREKANKKQWEAKAGYTSPLRLFTKEAFGLDNQGEEMVADETATKT